MKNKHAMYAIHSIDTSTPSVRTIKDKKERQKVEKQCMKKETETMKSKREQDE